VEQRVRDLLAINRALAESLDYEALLELVVDNATRLAAASEGALLLSDDEGMARVAASRGIPPERARAFSARFDEGIHGALRDLLAYEDAGIFLGVPVIHGGKVTGILALHQRGREVPDPDEELILGALADQAAIALDHASRYRQLWQQSQAAQRELELAAQRKDQFLAMLAHELRNPLAAIVNAISVLRLLPPGDVRREGVHAAANRQVQHMKRLLDELLDVSRVTRNLIEIERRATVLQEVLQHALQGSRALADERRHEVALSVPDEPVVVEGDPDRLVQVVSNLVTNAVKYTEPGGRIELLLRVEGSEAVLRVRDDGVGIAPHLLDSVFDLFVQARPGARGQGGLGIGLSLVRRLVEMHGGTVAAHSDGVGRGSEFVVRLPLSPLSSHAAPDQPPAPARSEVRPLRILIVEDNADVGELLAQGLGGLGHRVRLAGDGESALRELDREPAQVVIVDIGLPGMDGYELARKLRRATGEDGPLLVALTGFGSADDRRRATEAGFDEHLVKPVQLDQLARVLDSGVRREPAG
jgi:signal transduction histidine kinase/ActR/RegA family two-component response regulator